MTEKEKAAAGYLYNPNYDMEPLVELHKCMDLCYDFNQLRPSQRVEQTDLLKQILGKMGQQVYVNAPFFCDYGYNTMVGNNIPIT